MSTEEPEAKRDEAKPRERRRLKLIESYGAFSDDRLQEVAQKIRGITSDNDTQPTAPQGEVPLSTGEITESITQWITQCPLGETEGVKGNQDLENAKHITSEELQNFLDMANVCVSTAKEDKGKPIQNPHGFLCAQLRAGYINPPQGFKSRKVRAQELRNQQLEGELATIRRLKERERELQFELFVAQLSEEDRTRLDQEAQAQVKPKIDSAGELPEASFGSHLGTQQGTWAVA